MSDAVSGQRFEYIQQCIIRMDADGLPTWLPPQHQWDSVFLMMSCAKTVRLNMAEKLVQLGCKISKQHLHLHLRNIEIIVSQPELLTESLLVLDFFIEQCLRDETLRDVTVDMMCCCFDYLLYDIGELNLEFAYTVIERLLDNVDFSNAKQNKLLIMAERIYANKDQRVIDIYETRRDSNEYILK